MQTHFCQIRPILQLSLLHASISAPTLSQTGSNLQGSCLEMLLASPCPIFTPTTPLIKEKQCLATIASILVMVHFIFELEDQPLTRLPSICWIGLKKYGSLMGEKKRRSGVLPAKLDFIFSFFSAGKLKYIFRGVKNVVSFIHTRH